MHTNMQALCIFMLILIVQYQVVVFANYSGAPPPSLPPLPWKITPCRTPLKIAIPTHDK